jgi:hypothetical protein
MLWAARFARLNFITNWRSGLNYLGHRAAPAPGMNGATAIVAGILVARHLKTTEALFDFRSSPRTESMVAAAGAVGRANHAED